MGYSTTDEIQTQILEALNLTSAQDGSLVFKKMDDANTEIYNDRGWWWWTAKTKFDTVDGVEKYYIPPTTSTPVTMVANAATIAAIANTIYVCSGAMTAAGTLTVPTTAEVFKMTNSTTGGFAITVKTAAGTGISVPNGSTVIMACDGTNVIAASTNGNTLPSDFHRAIALWYEVSGNPYPIRVETEISASRGTYGIQTGHGTPQIIKLLKDQEMGIYPIPTAGYSIGFYYSKLPTAIATGQTPEIPWNHRELLYWLTYKKVAEARGLEYAYPIGNMNYKIALQAARWDSNQRVIDNDLSSIKRGNLASAMQNRQVLLYTP